MLDLNTIYLMRPKEATGEFDALYTLESGFVPDNGSPALAFRSTTRPVAYYIDIPSREPAGYHWHDEKWVWHRTLLRLGTPWDGRERHVNYLASRLAMDTCVKTYHVANGRPISVDNPEDYGYLYSQAGALLPKPENLSCALCVVGGHEILMLATFGRERTNAIQYARETAQKAYRDLENAAYEKEAAWSWLRTHRAELRKARLFEREMYSN